MIWERDPLWAKTKLFFERAFSEPPESPLFGLWCSLGLEMLARAAVASISPVLLAESDRDHRFLLHALNRGSAKVTPQSITATQLFALCRTLFQNFSEKDFTAALALVNRRNAELHSAAAAFEEYKPTVWLPGFYGVCKVLSEAIGETLETLFGVDEARAAAEILEETKTEAIEKVNAMIAAHKKVFEVRSLQDRLAASTVAANRASEMAYQRHHKVVCPACASTALVQGEPFGQERIFHEDGDIVVRQSISPRSFACSACGLSFTGYAELGAAGLGGAYTRTTTMSPQDYYGLVDPDTDDMTPYVEQYLEDMHSPEYDNE